MTRLTCIAYLILLTALLLVADPLRLIGARADAGLWISRWMMPVAHLLSFGVLTALALVARWPLPRWTVVIVLAAYGAMTEVAQSFLPPRTAQWADWLQDMAGIAAASALCWLAAVSVTRMRLTWQPQPCCGNESVEQNDRGACLECRDR